MIPAAFDYVLASSLDEALSLLGESEDSKVIAGGQSLIPLLKFRLSSPGILIDIGGLRELSGISRDGDSWRIGALTTYRELLDHDELCVAYPLLADAINDIGDLQVRNRGTVGGAIAHADPALDFPAVALALDAEILIRWVDGERSTPLDGFFDGAFTTGLGAGELVIGIRTPDLPAGAGTGWSSLTQSASGYSLAGVAAVVGDGHARVAVAGVGEMPYRATAVEEALAGGADAAAAAAHATEGQTVASDIHADAEYRSALAEIQVRRAIERAMGG
ncbi:MAG: xanthine dehydrogenase family protein subunit M [Chloroflexi bacterium]|nr:xanthine dehydrogenase family protein subunit M [Chloroflexota bacterium]